MFHKYHMQSYLMLKQPFSAIVVCCWCQSFDDAFQLLCVNIILVRFGLLSGHLLRKSCSLGILTICNFSYFPLYF